APSRPELPSRLSTWHERQNTVVSWHEAHSSARPNATAGWDATKSGGWWLAPAGASWHSVQDVDSWQVTHDRSSAAASVPCASMKNAPSWLAGASLRRRTPGAATDSALGRATTASGAGSTWQATQSVDVWQVPQAPAEAEAPCRLHHAGSAWVAGTGYAATAGGSSSSAGAAGTRPKGGMSTSTWHARQRSAVWHVAPRAGSPAAATPAPPGDSPARAAACR